MALGSKTMKTAMNIAWAATKITGITLAKTASFTLKAAWKIKAVLKK